MDTQTQRGSSLVEVMVALFVLAIGLLGMLAMQAKSMQYNQSAYSYSQAAYLAADMAERIRSNAGVAATYGGGAVDASADAGNCTSTKCLPADIVAWDKAKWAKNIDNYLPSGTGSITAIGTDFLQITVAFVDDKVSADNTAGETQTYSLIVEI